MVTDLMVASDGADTITMSPLVWDAMMELRQWLFDNVYLSRRAKAEEPKAFGIVRQLFEYYLEHPESLSDEFRPTRPEDVPQCVTDYVSGMTDRFALKQFDALFIPRNWMF